MTDLRARLADALRKHRYSSYHGCEGCNWTFRLTRKDHDEHLADVLLSLDGIAIVELPEPEMAEVIGVEYWDCDGEQDQEMHLTVAVPEDFGPNDWRVHDSPQGKRKLAAALLAAANKAEESKRDDRA